MTMTVPATLTEDMWSPWLASLQPRTAVFCRADVLAPWGFRIESRPQATFHVLTRGKTLLELDGVADPIEMTKGDLVLLPHGSAHQLKDDPSSAVRPLEEAAGEGTAKGKIFAFGGDGTGAVMVCGGCDLGVSTGGAAATPSFLPPVIRHQCDRSLVEVMETESRSLANGAEAVLSQTLRLLVVQALRNFLAERTEGERRGLITPDVSRAVAFIHRNFGSDLDIDAICAVARVSRSTLTQHFTQHMGVPPISYLRMTRLSYAAELLRTTDRGVKQVARAVGYRSTSSFSRAFLAQYGTTPGSHRQEA